MKYLILSDIHGNLPALESVIKKEIDVQGYINLGDVVNYGPWSNECVDLLDSLTNTINILGNHEEYFIEGRFNLKNKLVNSFFQHTYPSFLRLDKIKSYKKTMNFMDFKITHNLKDKTYIFNDSPVNIQENCMIGHSHQQYFRKVEDKLLINPGSVGQNRKFINLSNYIIWDIEKNTFDLKQKKFDLKLILNEMKIKNYPNECINYYKNKNKYK